MQANPQCVFACAIGVLVVFSVKRARPVTHGIRDGARERA
jgi:hypothetical protein